MTILCTFLAQIKYVYVGYDTYSERSYQLYSDLDRIALVDKNPGELGESILNCAPPGDFI